MTMTRSEPWLAEMLQTIDDTIEANCPGEQNTFVFVLVSHDESGMDLRISGNTSKGRMSELFNAAAASFRDLPQ